MALHLIGYARVSTDEQALYGYGLDAQDHDDQPATMLFHMDNGKVREWPT